MLGANGASFRYRTQNTGRVGHSLSAFAHHALDLRIVFQLDPFLLLPNGRTAHCRLLFCHMLSDISHAKNASSNTLVNAISTILATASLVFAVNLGYWVQVEWRPSERNFKILAARFHEARIG